MAPTLQADGWAHCLLGVSAQQPGRQRLVVYDADKIVRTLVRDGLSPEDALEYLEFNITGARVGERVVETEAA